MDDILRHAACLRTRWDGAWRIDDRPIGTWEMYCLTKLSQHERESMDINSCYPGSYLKAADLQHRTVKCIIDKVQVEDIGGEDKPVLYFLGKQKRLSAQ